MLGYHGGSLQDKYESLKKELARSESKASGVTRHINKVESVAGDLFDEWGKELESYSNDNLRRSSRRQLDETRLHYD